MRVEGVATPVPVPGCLTSGGDDHWPLGTSTHAATTLSGFFALTLREHPRGYAACMFLGEDLLAYLVLAIGGAMAAGSILALVRPPEVRGEGDLDRAPLGRSLAFAAIGLVGAVWALASLVRG